MCKATKPADDFYRDARRVGGLYSRCKDCHNARAYPGQQKYKAANRTEVRKWDSRWRHEHPEHGQIHGQRRRARKKDAPVRDFTKEQWAALKVAYRGCCAYCGQRTRLTIDHVIPLVKGGSHTVSNIVPACKSCNSKKNDRDAPTHQPHLLV